MPQWRGGRGRGGENHRGRVGSQFGGHVRGKVGAGGPDVGGQGEEEGEKGPEGGVRGDRGNALEVAKPGGGFGRAAEDGMAKRLLFVSAQGAELRGR